MCIRDRLQEFLGDQVVLHHADHELQQLRIFCPRQYFAGALATWQSPELFAPMPTFQSSNIHEHLTHTIPPSLRTRYKWDFRKDFTIPYGIVHLKEKKQWRKGRTIISYFQSLSGNLLRITSRALDIEPLTSSYNTSFLSIQANFPFHNCGPTFTATSLTPHRTFPYTPPTTALLASSTQFNSIA